MQNNASTTQAPQYNNNNNKTTQRQIQTSQPTLSTSRQT